MNLNINVLIMSADIIDSSIIYIIVLVPKYMRGYTI